MSTVYGYPYDDCNPRPCNRSSYSVCRGPRGIQGPPGLTSTNDNAVIYYLNATNQNLQVIPLGNQQTNTFLFNSNNINGTAITLPNNNITLAAGTYSIELSTYALIPTLAIGETLNLNVFLAHSGIPAVPTPSTQSIPVYGQIAQHIYIPTILETSGTTLTVNAILTSSIPTTTAIDEITFINTVLTIIRLGANTPT